MIHAKDLTQQKYLVFHNCTIQGCYCIFSQSPNWSFCLPTKFYVTYVIALGKNIYMSISISICIYIQIYTFFSLSSSRPYILLLRKMESNLCQKEFKTPDSEDIVFVQTSLKHSYNKTSTIFSDGPLTSVSNNSIGLKYFFVVVISRKNSFSSICIHWST